VSTKTKSLVSSAARYIIPACLSAAVALGAVALVNRNPVHASAETAGPLDNQSVAALTALDSAMEAVAARVTPAVVNIAVTSTPSMDEVQQQQGGGEQQGIPPGLEQFFGPGGPFSGFGGGQQQPPQQPQLEHGIGSGVIISPDGYIVTNDHVVDGAVQIKVTMQDRRVLTAKLIGVDKLDDLAVIKIDGGNLPYMQWGDSSTLKPGETVLAFGSPFGSFQDSVTRGIVSAVNRENPYRDDARKPGGYIQTDAAINPGNSGGALVNAHGELVGIPTFIISNSGSFAGAGFAIPSAIAQKTVQELIAHGKVEHGYLGVNIENVTPENAQFFNLKEATGALVSQVTPDSPAAQAGLKSGDVIDQLDGHKVLDSSSLQIAISQDHPGQKVQLGIIRNGQTMTLTANVGEYHKPGTEVAANGAAPGAANTGKLGLAVDDLSSDARQQLNVPSDVHGAAVADVRPGSPAEDAGLQPGDVVVEVNRKPVASAEQFANAVHSTPTGKDILLLVWSKGNASYRVIHPSDGNQNGM
jgi:serine protease Do